MAGVATRTGTVGTGVVAVPSATAVPTVTPTATAVPTAIVVPTAAAPASSTAAPAIANRSAWDGATLALQAGTTLALALPPPSASGNARLPTISADGLPALTSALLPDGSVAITLPIPAKALGQHTLLVRWPDGSGGSLSLTIGAAASLATGLGTPDDVAVAPDGSVLYGNLKDNTVDQLLADNTRRVLVSHLTIPEGLAVTGPASLLIADQGSNRVLEWTAPAGLRTLLQLAARRGVEGIDGLASAVVDGQAVALLPDSANGRMLLLRLDTLATVPVPGSWKRPTDAVVRNGLLYLVDEYGGRLWRGPLQGPLQPLGPVLDLPDDVAVTADGTSFVNDLGRGTTGGRVTQINSNGGGATLLSGLNDPQGMALDGGDNLILTESGNGRLSALVRSCLPLLLGAAQQTLQVGGPAQVVPIGSDCSVGTPPPSFSLAVGARWPAPAGTTWDAVPGASLLTLPNGVVAHVQASAGGAAVLTVRPPVNGPAATATLAVQMRVGGRSVARQIVVTVQG
jgi:hypothetical protein